MNRKEFSIEFGRLHAIFGRVNPKEEMGKEWFDSLKGVSQDVLHKVIDSFRDTETEFPASPGVLWAKIRDVESVKKLRPSCSHCENGRIFYSRNIGLNQRGDPLSYDFYAACDCASGDFVADQMIGFWRKKGINVRVPQAARYSWLFQRYGGIGTAVKGRGVSPDKPPVVPDGAGFRSDGPPTVEGELDSMFETGRTARHDQA